MPFAATWMDLEIIIVSEAGQTKKEKYHMYHLHVESKKSYKELIYKTETNLQTGNKFMVTQVERWRREGLIRRLGLTYTYYYIQNRSSQGPIV